MDANLHSARAAVLVCALIRPAAIIFIEDKQILCILHLWTGSLFLEIFHQKYFPKFYSVASTTNYSTGYLSVCLPIYSCCSVKCVVSLQFLNLRHSAGLLGRVISPSQCRYQDKHRINANIHALSRIWNQYSSVRAAKKCMLETARPLC
jgi:hypothetical protein